MDVERIRQLKYFDDLLGTNCNQTSRLRPRGKLSSLEASGGLHQPTEF
jgi:hypothetical protein